LSLEQYRKKRNFKATPEPLGERKPESSSRFVVQKHQATHLHYDFRLELDGVLKSWAVPKGPPVGPGIRRLAVAVEDHPVDYISFEGTIPEGEYGAGTVEIWDKGTFDLKERTDKAFSFALHGKKLQGDYRLVNFKDKNWLLFKVKPKQP
jgi:DNA ligase D-like protein (predicted 3'-phosphoesterase)